MIDTSEKVIPTIWSLVHRTRLTFPPNRKGSKKEEASTWIVATTTRRSELSFMKYVFRLNIRKARGARSRDEPGYCMGNG